MLLALSVRDELTINSNRIADSSRLQIQSLQDGLRSIRDVILDGTQSIYVENYRKADWSLRKFQVKNQFLSAFPRYIVEAAGLVLIALFSGFYVLSDMCVFHYKWFYDGKYPDVEDQFTIKWNDPDINIFWPSQTPILQKRDL